MIRKKLEYGELTVLTFAISFDDAFTTLFIV
jgi:hypothetical protein